MLDGYTRGETVYEGPSTVVYRALDAETTPVVVKTFAKAYPAPAEVARLEHEFDLGKDLRIPGVVRYHRLHTHAGSCTLVMEDFGGSSLTEHLREGPLALADFLALAPNVAIALGALHERDIVHKDLSPGNIYWNRATGEAKVGDLGLASLIPRSKQSLVNPKRLQGTLPYISPEQTGRMNRAIDYRTDLYSLGATFFELLCGRPPFEESDAMALIHAHIAKAPPVPAELREMPRALSDVVLRLLAKTAEERYQSAEGLSADLEAIARAYSEGRDEPLELGRHDSTHIFRVSQRLYGRATEVQGLLEAFDHVGEGACALILVRGYSGIGKSMLVSEVHKPMVAKRGYFIAGKYDQLEMTNPLSALVQALRDGVRQLLTEDGPGLERWRQVLQTAVGVNGRVMTDQVPELEAIIGPQPELYEIGSVEARERFDNTLLSFVQALASKEHPLVLFLDDLQWVDAASLRWLRLLITHPESRNLMVICAYRDNEVPPSHPFALALKGFEQVGVPMRAFTLAPLPLDDLSDFIGDSLLRAPAEVGPLAELVQRKTQGNPFFVAQFLRSLAEAGMLQYQRALGAWDWDMARIGVLEVIETVVDLMLEKIKRHPPEAQALLSMASCLGNTFDLETLAILTSGHEGADGVTPQQLKTAARGLWAPLRDGLIFPMDRNYQYYQWSNLELEGAPPPQNVLYKFAHDRIQEAAYRAIPADTLEQVNLRIGRLLLSNLSEAQREERIFDLVNHLNLGRALMGEAAEREQLAELNRRAGHRAKEATAFGAARSYFVQAMSLLPEEAWETDYDLSFDLHRERVDCEFLCGHWEEATRFFDLTKGEARTRAHIADLYQLMIRILLQADKVWDATEVALNGCRELGLSYPTDPAEQDALIERELATFDEHMAGADPFELLNRPRMDDPDTEQLLGVLHETWSAAVMAGNANVVAWSAIKTVTAAIERGNSVFTSGGYIALTQILSIEERYEEADAIGRMAMQMARDFGEAFLIPKVNNTYCNFTSHFVNHTRTVLPIYEESYAKALLSGDSWWGSWAVGWLRCARLITGFPLSEVLAVRDKFHDYIVSSAYRPLEEYSWLDRQITLNLLGRTKGPFTFSSEDYDERGYLDYFESTNFGYGLHLHYLYKAMTHCSTGPTRPRRSCCGSRRPTRTTSPT